jgi:hypothetical protein
VNGAELQEPAHAAMPSVPTNATSSEVTDCSEMVTVTMDPPPPRPPSTFPPPLAPIASMRAREQPPGTGTGYTPGIVEVNPASAGQTGGVTHSLFMQVCEKPHWQTSVPPQPSKIIWLHLPAHVRGTQVSLRSAESGTSLSGADVSEMVESGPLASGAAASMEGASGAAASGAATSIEGASGAATSMEGASGATASAGDVPASSAV